jgi:hypothetical protein
VDLEEYLATVLGSYRNVFNHKHARNEYWVSGIVVDLERSAQTEGTRVDDTAPHLTSQHVGSTARSTDDTGNDPRARTEENGCAIVSEVGEQLGGGLLKLMTSAENICSPDMEYSHETSES